ncbi:hypothetical protein AmaxDRAFT_4868 [Limnospira maxima CS-328]|uniref:Uncharacterized protein n=1 Tax=Limnospira maxima CS-328 TaxID=513049 RepID=B5W7W8_LIMMA|nr:hypothetical protein AmaxDRAFT_4868 [Limnospira maxima CS-328]
MEMRNAIIFSWGGEEVAETPPVPLKVVAGVSETAPITDSSRRMPEYIKDNQKTDICPHIFPCF